MMSLLSKLSMVVAAAGLLVIAQAGEKSDWFSASAGDSTKAEGGCGGCPSTVPTSLDGKATCGGGGCSSTASATACASQCSTKSSEGACGTACASTATAADGCSGCSKGGTTLTSAADGGCCLDGGSPGAECTSACSTADKACGDCTGTDCQTCPVTAAMARLPKITYVVGEAKVCCPKAAAELTKSGGEMKYLVGDQSFGCSNEAQRALVEATEKFVAAFAEPKKCAASGSITVAGNQFGCEQAAKQCSSIAQSAMDEVRMTYLVGEKSCCCPAEAKQLAETSGEPTVYVVAEEKTACDLSARLNLARAKYKAAVVALTRAQSPAETAATGS